MSPQATEASAPGKQFTRAALGEEEAKATGSEERKNKTWSRESPDLRGSDPRGLPVNGDS
jgi:hypothetical protein